MLKPIGIGLMCFIIFLSIHACIFHFRKISEKWKVLSNIFYIILLVYPLLYWLVPPDPLFSMIPSNLMREPAYRVSSVISFLGGLMLYAFLFIGYLEFYFTADRSFTVKIVQELENAAGKKMTREEIGKIFSVDMIVERRLDDMMWGGYMVEHNGYYSNTRKGSFVAKLYKFVIEFLNLVGGAGR